MTPAEHLEKIAAKCRDLLSWNTGAVHTEAALRSTLAAIEGLRPLTRLCPNGCDTIADDTIAAIIAAWPEEIL